MTETDDQDLIAEYPDEAEEILDICLEQQITCMFLQYAASMEIKKDIGRGMTMLKEVEKVRNDFKESQKEIESLLGEEEIKDLRQFIEFDKRLYSQLSNTAIEANSKYFTIAPRPAGAEYACDEKTCTEASLLMAKEYFPELLAA